MKMIMGEIETNVKVTSHILEAGPDPNIFSLFHCWKCGQKIHQFSGTEIMSLPGGVFTRLPIIMLCRFCKQRHLFHSIL